MKIKGICFVYIGFFMTLTCSHLRLEKAKKKPSARRQMAVKFDETKTILGESGFL